MSKHMLISKLNTPQDIEEHKNIYITNKILKTCLTINNNLQLYLASCDGSKNQQWDVKYDKSNFDISVIHSHTGWSLEYFVSENPLIIKDKFLRSSYEYICGTPEKLPYILEGIPLITAPKNGKSNQNFQFSASFNPMFNGLFYFFIIRPKNCFGTVSVNLEDPNHIVGIYTEKFIRNRTTNLWKLSKFNFSDEAKSKFLQKPQILKISQADECLTTKKNGEVYIRRCLGTDNQLWFNDYIDNNFVIRNKENEFSLDLNKNQLVTSKLNENNKNQKWKLEYSQNFSGYFMLINEESKKCVSINLDNWNDDHLFLETCDIFNKMQQFKFEIYQEDPLYYKNIMPTSNIETRYLVNKGTGLCIDVSDQTIFKNIECKDIPGQRFAISNEYKDLEQFNQNFGFKNILIYSPHPTIPTSFYMNYSVDQITRGGITYEFYLRFIYSEVFPYTFQLTNDWPGEFKCISVKKAATPYYVMGMTECDPTDIYQHWQLVRVEDYGKDLTPIKPIKNDPPPVDNPQITIKGELRNATNDLIIPNSDLEGLLLEFRNGNGDIIPSNVEGSKYNVKLKEGVYTVTIRSKNFSEFIDEITILKDEKNQEKNFLLSPTTKGGIRIVLTWNNKIKDLDLFAITSTNEKISFSNKVSKDGSIQLDIDKRDGFGPETITVNENNKDDKIEFFVHNYSNENHITKSDAKVKVYLDNKLVENLKVPRIPDDPKQRLWDLGVFDRYKNKFYKVDKLK